MTRVSVARAAVERALARSGVRVDGARPWDLRVHDDRFFLRSLAGGSLGVGEAYMDGWWDCERLDELACRVVRGGADDALPDALGAALALYARGRNLQTPRRAPAAVAAHYDLGNEFFAAMLDPRMAYSCGYWREATDRKSVV